MGDSELFSDLKSDFERSYRSEILVAGSSGVRAQKLWRLAVTMACLSSTETKYFFGTERLAKKPSFELAI